MDQGRIAIFVTSSVPIFTRVKCCPLQAEDRSRVQAEGLVFILYLQIITESCGLFSWRKKKKSQQFQNINKESQEA